MRRSIISRKIAGRHQKPRARCILDAACGLTAALLLLPAAFPSTAAARAFVSLHFGVPLVVGPPVYYVPPPPPYYVPPPVVYAPPPPPPQACHEYQTTATIDGVPHRIVGTACLQPDGTWRVTQ